MNSFIENLTPDQMREAGWQIIASLPPATDSQKLDAIRVNLGMDNVRFTSHSNGTHDQILVWARSAKAISHVVKRDIIVSLTSFVATTMALIFFFWADWRVGVGYVLLTLSFINLKSAKSAFLHAYNAAKGGDL